MIEYTWNRVRYLSGTSDLENDLERDLKFDAWIGGRKYMITSSADVHNQRRYAQSHDVDILIIKD